MSYAQDAPDTAYYADYSGTSIAAAHVSGGLAILKDYFKDQLGNTEILNRLFQLIRQASMLIQIFMDKD